MTHQTLTPIVLKKTNISGTPKIYCKCCILLYACKGLRQKHLLRNGEKDNENSCRIRPTYFQYQGDLKELAKTHKRKVYSVCTHCEVFFFATVVDSASHQNIYKMASSPTSQEVVNEIKNIQCDCCALIYACNSLK